MRRLGFLDILLCECVKNGSHDYSNLGELLWKRVEENQTTWLKLLGEQRGLNNKVEVGSITKKITSRYVKLAVELGFLAKGYPKILTDNGMLFKRLRGIPFFLTQGQKILYWKRFLFNDKLVVPYLIKHIAEAGKLTKDDLKKWFANEHIPFLLSHKKFNLTVDEAERLKNAKQSFDKGKVDNIKHMADTRIEQLADLDIIAKSKSVCFSTEVTKEYAKYFDNINPEEINEDDFYRAVAQALKVKKVASEYEILNAVVKESSSIATPPTYLVPLGILRDLVCINAVTEKNVKILPSKVKEAESRLVREYYGKVQLFEGRTTEKAYIIIPSEVRKELTGIRISA